MWRSASQGRADRMHGIFSTVQFVKTVGLEEPFAFLKIRIFNFLTNKKGNLQQNIANSQSWQGH